VEGQLFVPRLGMAHPINIFRSNVDNIAVKMLKFLVNIGPKKFNKIKLVSCTQH